MDKLSTKIITGVILLKIVKLNKHIKKMLIRLFGIQYVNPIKMSLDIISDLKFRYLLCEDDFGVYKKLIFVYL